MSDFGQKLRELRLRKKLTQEELAKLLGTSKQVISRYENAKRSPSVSVANEYAEKLGVSLDYFGTTIANKDDAETELYQMLQLLKDRPEMQTLFHSSVKATKDDIIRAAKFLDAMADDSQE